MAIRRVACPKVLLQQSHLCRQRVPRSPEATATILPR